jgi:hypothetical protein
MTNRIAPKGTVWVCHACGKTHSDKYGLSGKGSYGWDESCMLNSSLYPLDKLVFVTDKDGNETKRVKEVLND